MPSQKWLEEAGFRVRWAIAEGQGVKVEYDISRGQGTGEFQPQDIIFGITEGKTLSLFIRGCQTVPPLRQ